MYKILPAHRKKAKKLGVTIKSSTVKGKKIDVFKDGKKVSSIGAKGYGDFEYFKKEKGETYANSRRKAYNSRHAKDPKYNSKGQLSAGYYAKEILW